MYTAIWIATGTCTCQTDLSSYEINAPALLFFTPFQSYNLLGEHTFSGEQVYFHGDFYCIERHRKEVACNGILFNNVYTSPVVALDEHYS